MLTQQNALAQPKSNEEHTSKQQELPIQNQAGKVAAPSLPESSDQQGESTVEQQQVPIQNQAGKVAAPTLPKSSSDQQIESTVEQQQVPIQNQAGMVADPTPRECTGQQVAEKSSSQSQKRFRTSSPEGPMPCWSDSSPELLGMSPNKRAIFEMSLNKLALLERKRQYDFSTPASNGEPSGVVAKKSRYSNVTP